MLVQGGHCPLQKTSTNRHFQVWHRDGSSPFYALAPYGVKPGGDMVDPDKRQDNSPSEMDEESDSDQQEQGPYHIPSPAQPPDCCQDTLPRVKIFLFFKPSHQDFIQDMIVRSTRTLSTQTLVSFLLPTSHKYYETLLVSSPFCKGRLDITYRYSLKDICFLQERLSRDLANVMPPPMPTIFLKPTDYIGPRCILPGESGWVPSGPRSLSGINI